MKLGNLLGKEDANPSENRKTDFLKKMADLKVSQIKVKEYQLATAKNKPIRKATKVIFPDGEEIAFLEKMSKKEALNNGIYHYFVKKGYPKDEAQKLAMEML